MKNYLSACWFVASVGALLACSDGGTTDDGTANAGGGGGGNSIEEMSAKEYYSKFVHPELVQSCGTCHSAEVPCVPRFMRDNIDASYDALRSTPGVVVYKDDSTLIHHGAHTGPALSAGQEELVVTWLDKERPDEPEGDTFLSAVEAFGDCMNFDVDYMDPVVGFYLVPFQQTNSGPCYSCHATGEAGTWLGTNESESFEKNRRLPFIKRLVKATFDENGHFLDLTPSNRYVDKLLTANQCGSLHPAGAFDDDKANAITEYVNRTRDRWLAGTCE
jgi:hypothetical protein